MQKDEHAVVVDGSTAGGVGDREQNVEIVEGAEKRGYPDQTAHDERDSDGDFSESRKITEEVRVGNDKSGDECAMPCEGILFYTVEQLLWQGEAAQEASARNFGPGDQKKQNADQNTHQGEIAEV